jgi:hypothetical protein
VPGINEKLVGNATVMIYNLFYYVILKKRQESTISSNKCHNSKQNIKNVVILDIDFIFLKAYNIVISILKAVFATLKKLYCL